MLPTSVFVANDTSHNVICVAKQLVYGGVEPGNIACHLEGSRASSLFTRAIDDSTARVGVGKVSLCSDLIGNRPTLVRGDISIKRVHCVSYVFISGVCVRRELVFSYISIVNII